MEGPPPIPHARVAEADLDETADLAGQAAQPGMVDVSITAPRSL